jgi:hypothetical protein
MASLAAVCSLSAPLALAGAVCPPAETVWPDVVAANSFDQLQQKLCSASRDGIHVFVLPASLFVNSRELVCDDAGVYRLYRVVGPDDRDEFEYYIDPPTGHASRLGCDGKAGKTMHVIAVNCRPE